MMTKKDYIAIAEIIRVAANPITIAYGLSQLMASDNPNFDRQKFLKACGVEK